MPSPSHAAADMPVPTMAMKASPLGNFAPFQGVNTRIEERPFLGKLTLRGDPSEASFRMAVERATGIALPLDPNKAHFRDNRTLAWVGPNEWLLHTPEGEEEAVKVALNDALADKRAAVVDVSDYYTVIRVEGPQARDLLAKGCPLDLHPSKFGPGDCAGSLFIKALIHLIQTDETPAYTLQVRWSVADYLWRNLVRAAEEWG